MANLKRLLLLWEGTFYLTRESSERGIKIGDKVKEGDTVAYIESMKVMNAIVAEKSGTVAEILVNNGDEVEEDDVIIKLA
jgi:pyruvate carboxylase subunit B